MSRGGRARTRKGGLPRRCIATGVSLPKAEMIRFVVAPSGELVADLAQKLPGRGIWLRSSRDLLEKALRKGLFVRAARRKLHIEADFAAQLEGLLLRRLQDWLAMARKAGVLVGGFEKTREALSSGRAVALFGAVDGSRGGKSKLSPPEGTPVFECLSGSEMGLAFGREYVIHAALLKGSMAKGVMQEAARLTAFRKGGEVP